MGRVCSQLSVLSCQLTDDRRVGWRQFHNGTRDGLGGPFVGPCNSFGECRFSLLEVSLGYNVLRVLKSLQAASFQ